jgi:hypothetical protein
MPGKCDEYNKGLQHPSAFVGYLAPEIFPFDRFSSSMLTAGTAHSVLLHICDGSDAFRGADEQNE